MLAIVHSIKKGDSLNKFDDIESSLKTLSRIITGLKTTSLNVVVLQN